MMRSDTIEKLAASLCKAQKEFPVIPKTKTANVPTKAGGAYKYKYADLSDIISMITPVLHDNSLSVTQGMSVLDKDTAILETTIMHSSGQYISSSMPIKMYDRPQETGSEITYMRRYSLTAALGIHADEDEDGEGASNHGTRSKRAQSEPTVPPPVIPQKAPHVPAPQAYQQAIARAPQTGVQHLDPFPAQQPKGAFAKPMIVTPPKLATLKQIKLIWARLGAELGIDGEDEGHAFFAKAVGDKSSKEYTSDDINKILDAIQRASSAHNDGR